MVFRPGALLPLLLLSAFLGAQDFDDVRFGKVSAEELAALPPAGDSTAGAYVLYDRLDLKFVWLQDKGPARTEYFHTRTKLLKASSFDLADLEISYDRSYQKLHGLHAVIHLPTGESVKLSRRDFIREQDKDQGETIKFTYPQVTAGAIIEFEYTLTTESILIPSSFAFQRKIPVRWAEYSASIPIYYNYVSLGTNGQYAVNEVGQSRRAWGPSFRNAPADNNDHVAHTEIRWAMRDVESFRVQPYTNNLHDYLPRVRLQLQEVAYPGEIVQPIFSNWKQLAEELLDRDDFGDPFLNRGTHDKMWDEARKEILAGTTDKERIDAAYYYVCRRLRSNSEVSFLGTESPDKLLAEGMGNSADLNLSLLAMLREAGIEAYPLLVSLRDGGSPIEFYPILTQFDHLMVYTEVDGKPYLLDANGPSRPPGLPRVASLNHRGWLVDADQPRWVDVEVPQARQVVMATIRLDEAGGAEVDLQSRLTSYYAFSGRGQLQRQESPDDTPIASEVLSAFPEARLLTHEVGGGDDDASAPLSVNLSMQVPAAMASDDFLYLQPVLIPMLNKELDDVETRLYPVDFPYPWQLDYVANVVIPEGYTVEELPESIRMQSEDGGMSATYSVTDNGSGLISLVFRVSLDRTVYQAADYPMLRHMYRRIIDLQEANIVFTRAK